MMIAQATENIRIDRTAHGRVVVTVMGKRDISYVGRHQRGEWNAYTAIVGQRTAIAVNLTSGGSAYAFGTIDANAEMRIVNAETGKAIDTWDIDSAFIL